MDGTAGVSRAGACPGSAGAYYRVGFSAAGAAAAGYAADKSAGRGVTVTSEITKRYGMLRTALLCIYFRLLLRPNR